MIFIIFVLSACGRNRVDDYIPNGDYEDDATLDVLSILIPDSFRLHYFRTAETTLNQVLYEFNKEFELEIVTFPWNDIDNHMTRMAVTMMAGEMYDIFLLMPQHHNLWHFSQSGFLANIYTLIDDCRHTNREDFFINALDAFTINDGLYAFPLHFKFEYIAISAAMPQEFIDRFYEMDAITPAEMMLMYTDLRSTYPYDFDSFYVARNVKSLFSDLVFERMLSDFVNINERVSSINSNGFIALLDSIRHVHDMQGFSTEWHGTSWSSGFCSFGDIRQASMRYMFNSDTAFLNPIFAYFEPINHNFFHHIPLLNAHGDLYIANYYANYTSVPYVFSIAATGNEALAWDFLRHLIVPLVVESIDRYPMHPHALSFPIKRSYLESNFLAAIHHASFWIPQRFVGMGEEDEGREERIRRALDIHTAFSEMPVATIPLVPISIIEEDLSLFMDGIITAEDAALRMHNRVSLWLIE